MLEKDNPHINYSNSSMNKEKSLEIKEKRKIMNTLIKNLSSMRGSTYEELVKFVSDYLKNKSKDICEIYDEAKNTLGHFLTNEEKDEYLKIIIDSYYLLLHNKEKFFNWFMLENNENLTILDIACQKGNKKIIKYLFSILSKTDESIFHLTEKRNSIFHSSAKANQCYPIIFFYEKLQKFFPQIKIIDVSNEYNITPLHYACYSKSKNVVDLLLDLGADINAKDIDGKSILNYAVVSGSERIVKKLLFRGADREIKDNNGKKCIDVAFEKNYFDIVNLLKNQNCFVRNFCGKIEYGNLRGIRHDYTLIYSFLVYIIFILVFVIRIYISLNSNHIYDENYFFTEKNNILTDRIYLVGFIFFCIAIFTFLITLLYTCYFLCCQKRKKKKNYKKKSLISLFEDNPKYNICVICKRIMKDDTVHCIVCGFCIDNWDHHCFWLNTCIHKGTKKKFKLFFISIISTLVFNMFFGFFLIIYSFTGNNEEIIKIFFGDLIKTKSVLVFKIMSIIYTIIFCFPLIMNILIPCCKKNKPEKKKEETNLSDFETQFLNPSSDSIETS